MKYACRGTSDEDVPGPTISGPLFDEDPAHDPACLLGDGKGDPSALLPWIDDDPPPANTGVELEPAPVDTGLKLDLKKKELRAGNPDDPNAGYLFASAESQGARWRTNEGGFSGTANKDGLDSRIVLGEHDQLHGTVSAKDKSGALAWERDGKNQGELYGRFGGKDDFEGGVRRTWGLDSGTLTTGVRHQVTSAGATDGVFGEYKSTDAATTINGDAGIRDGGFVGQLSGRHALSDKSSITGSLAHGENGTTGKLGGTYGWDGGSASANAEVSNSKDGVGGALTGAYQNRGLSLDAAYRHTPTNDAFSLGGSYKLGAHDTLTGSLSHDKDRTAGKIGAAHTWDGGSLSGSAEVARTDAGVTNTFAGAYKNGGLSLDGNYVDAPTGDTWSLGGNYKLGDKGALDGRFTHAPNRDALQLSSSYKPSQELSLAGKLGYERNADGTQQGTLGLSEKYRSPSLVHGLDLDAGIGTRNYLSTTGSIDGRLGSNLYAGAWGNARVEEGKHASGQLGASMTYLPSDKTALTAAALVNDRGQFEARLELDILKKAIKDTPDLVDRRKDSPVSLFLSYAQGGGERAMDERYGAPQVSGSNGMISGGVRIKF